jgi:mycofactocin system glycosyltransferase
MPGQPPMGSFRFRSGIRLVQSSQGGIILQSNPLRALKINRSAYDILNQCRTGYRVDGDAHSKERPTIAMPFMDMLHQGGLLDWTPAQPRDLPLVSIVIPVFNRPLEIETCLDSLLTLDYPADKIEVIVVDDASRDHTPAVVRRYGVRLIVQPHNMGQSAARNAGVAAARGEIIAFLDSDCTAQPGWLRDLVPYFQDPRVALVGGYVDAYYREKRMDRYEQVCSALNMGRDQVLGRGDNCVFYVPTCNMLVRKQTYAQVGGLDESLHVGEDVDLCWRLMAAKHHLFYVPRGHVLHKHRNRFLSGFLRRFDYGTSEAVLYARFPKVAKQFPWQPAGIGMILAAAAALVTQSWLWLVLMAGLPAVESVCKRVQLQRRMDICLPGGEIFAAVIKSHFQLAYFLAFYMVRYHLLLLMVLSLVWPSGLWLCLTVVFLPTLETYLRKRPRLSFPVFAFFYLAEHAFYQSGAFWGCLKQKSFRLYRISFRYAGFMRRSKQHAESRSMAIKPRPKEAEAG